MRKTCSTCLFDDVCPFEDVCEHYSPIYEFDPNSVEYWENRERLSDILLDEWLEYIYDYSDSSDTFDNYEVGEDYRGIGDIVSFTLNTDGTTTVVFTDGTTRDILD